MQFTKYKLGDLIDVTRGASLSGEYYAEEGEFIRLTLGNFNQNGGGFKENTSKSDIYFTGPVKEEYILSEGDIITPLTEQSIGLLGTTARIPESNKYIQSQDVALIRCKDNMIDANFCYYLISSQLVRQQLSATAQQTKIRHTSPDKIKECVVWIPDLVSQKKIGKYLSLLDKKIALNHAINKNLEALAKQFYDYWFVQFDFPNEEGKPYKSSGGKMVWNEKLKRNIPEGWENTTLGDFCEMYQPQTIGTNELVKNGLYRVYGANGIVGRYNKFNHKGSEIAMACRGSSCGFLNRTMPYSWITGNAMVIQLKNQSICNEFIKQALAYMNIAGAITGSGQPQLTRENLNTVSCLKPSDDILIAFSQRVLSLVKCQIHIIEEIDKLYKQRDELLPLLMNGQITIK